MSTRIPVAIINVEKRTERKNHILKEFGFKAEFLPSIIKAVEDDNGTLGLWKTINNIIIKAKENNEEYIFICEDDHRFTDKYDLDILLKHIAEADQKQADVLLGGISWCNMVLQVSNDLFWVDKFNGLQFTIIYKRFFDAILEAEFEFDDAVDIKISKLSKNKLVIYPFISTQKEFGYSDVTRGNNIKGYVSSIFKKTAAVLDQLINVKTFYQALPIFDLGLTEVEYSEIQLPVYIINLPERKDRLDHIKKEYQERKEFDIIIIEACKHKIGAVGLWQSIVKIIKKAIENDDDVIMICEDDHQFTSAYSKEFLLKNIIEANEQGADILSGGSAGFQQVVPITINRYWVSEMFSTQFIVVYKNFFQRILNYKFKDTDTADGVISKLTSNKMLLFPFISIQKEFGYSDVTATNKVNDHVDKMFYESEKKLKRIFNATLMYCPDEHLI